MMTNSCWFAHKAHFLVWFWIKIFPWMYFVGYVRSSKLWKYFPWAKTASWAKWIHSCVTVNSPELFLFIYVQFNYNGCLRPYLYKYTIFVIFTCVLECSLAISRKLQQKGEIQLFCNCVDWSNGLERLHW